MILKLRVGDDELVLGHLNLSMIHPELVQQSGKSFVFCYQNMKY